MSTKSAFARPGQTSLSPLSPTLGTTAVHNALTPDSCLPCSRIALPQNYLISYASFICGQASPDAHQTIDFARKQIFESNSSHALEDSVLSYAYSRSNTPSLWLFTIEANVKDGQEGKVFASRLDDISLPGLTRTKIESFRYCDIYPCSSSCALGRNPCLSCFLTSHSSPNLSPSDSPASSGGSSESDSTFSEIRPIAAARAIPREPLRRPVAFFINAVRERLLYDICKEGAGKGRAILRLKDGLIWSLSNESNNWIDGWDHHGNSRPLTFCHVEITLFSSGLFVSPFIQTTAFTPFVSSFSPTPGSPINLLPFSAPAYYLNSYAGPTSALMKQFNASFKGLVPEEFLRTSEDFVIAWISVQNKQGDEKGIMVIWPACLCVSLLADSEGTGEKNRSPNHSSAFAYKRRILPFLPEMPLALQPSPIPAHAAVPAQRPFSPHFATSPSALTTAESNLFSSKEASPQVDLQSSSAAATEPPPFGVPRRVPSLHAPRAFRALVFANHQHRDFLDVAVAAGKYVDSVAKERERERDRIRKEREAVASGQVTKGSPMQQTPDTPNGGAGDTFQQPPTPGNSIVSLAHIPSSAGLAAQLVGFPSYASPLASHILQPTYPSPPDEAIRSERSISRPLSAGYPKAGDVFRQSTLPKVEPLDTYNNVDNFMADVNLAYGMDASKSAADEGDIVSVKNQVDFDTFGIFTDDDFNFFDEPIGPTTVPFSGSNLSTNSLAFEQVQSFDDEVLKSLDLAAPAFAPDFLNSLPATSDALFTSAAPQWVMTKPSVDDGAKDSPRLDEVDHLAPELVNCKSERSSMSPVGPLTPDIIGIAPLESDSESLFNPIHFHDRLQAVDAKYSSGKFFFPSMEKQSDEGLPSGIPHWRGEYTLATDPGIGVIKKLIGVKRRQTFQGGRSPADALSCSSGVYDDGSSAGDEESCDDLDTEFEDTNDEATEDSRPCTPLPSYVPLGPTLVPTQFAHSLLFPLSISLRSSGPSFSNTGIQSPVPNPVPTPVSPSAIGGHLRDKTASLVAFVQALWSEVIENKVWADDWRVTGRPGNTSAPISSAHDEGGSESSYLFSGGWTLKALSIDSMSKIANVSSPPTGSECVSLVPLVQPLITVGKSESIVNVSPPALRFWAKLGLAPRSGPKSVNAFVLFEDENNNTQFQEKVESWFRRVSDIYRVKGYGLHVPGKLPGCERDGLVPIHFATIHRTRVQLYGCLDSQPPFPILIYLVTSHAILSSTSFPCQRMFSVLKSITDGRPNVYYHLVPSSILEAEDDVSSGPKTELIADDVYNKIKRSVARFMSRPFFVQSEAERRLFSAPSFILAQSPPAMKAIFSDHSSVSADIAERHTFLHVGYKLSRCRTWLVAAAIDQRGENQDVKIWHNDGEYSDEEIVGLVWSFAVDFAGLAKVEWRLAIAKLGPFEHAHLEAWNTPLSRLWSNRRDIPVQVSILSVEDPGWSVHGPTLRSTPGLSAMNDAYLKKDMFSLSSAWFTLSQFLRLPLSSSRRPNLGTELNHISEEDGSEQVAECLMPLQTAVLINSSRESPLSTNAVYIHLLASVKSPGSTLTYTEAETHRDICQSYHDLAVLTKLRWRLPSHAAFPYHLAALQVADEVLERVGGVSD